MLVRPDAAPGHVRRAIFSQEENSTPILLGRAATTSLKEKKEGGEGESSVPAGARSVPWLFPYFCLSVCFNRIFYRIQLVPMKEFTYFISQFTSIGYIVAYWSLVLIRKRQGLITQEMLDFAWTKWRTFIAIGFFEATSFSIGVFSAARIPGGLQVVLYQTTLVWTLLFSRVLLGDQFDRLQGLGILTVILGVLLCALPQAAEAVRVAASAMAGQLLWINSGLYCISTAGIGMAGVLKDKLFRQSNKTLDITVVSAIGSTGQAVWTLLLLPLTFSFASSMPVRDYLTQGWAAFTGSTYSFMPWLWMAYMVANLSLNLSAVKLNKIGGQVALSVSSTILLPISALVFSLNIPLIGASPFSFRFVLGLLILTVGSMLFNHEKWASVRLPFLQRAQT